MPVTVGCLKCLEGKAARPVTDMSAFPPEPTSVTSAPGSPLQGSLSAWMPMTGHDPLRTLDL